ncbi:ribosomal biogenesis factor-like, partial [Cyprinus carpio]|uniref:Ribosomal biogenesis factor-like n=1 Tax=Cyprinus carpio TaxID=7962 RepID=A0A9Q9XU88_CYPCA
MAKNKQRGKKQQNVFQVANKQSKPKTKAKPVKTSLKHVSSSFVYISNAPLGLHTVLEIWNINKSLLF